MTLSMGIPIGIVIGVFGVFVFFLTKYKKTAAAIMGCGTLIALLTFVVVLLVVSSPM